ncbi:MAG: radical SAM family heme chaperone HemW [Eubacterium sp.]|nr:radical SAM family heme chaperone HemW [Eubacterium sp.]
MNCKNIELYVHIPFCVRKCAYCDFLSGPADAEIQRRYVDRLIEEIRNTGKGAKVTFPCTVREALVPAVRARHNGTMAPDASTRKAAGGAIVPVTLPPVSSVFFGGGTPSVLPADLICRIMETIRSCFNLTEDAEISMEANPGTVDAEKLAAYRKAGINRISFGCQSTDNEELKALGRIHTWEQFLESYSLARQAGFKNINVDLMSGLPGQTVDSWKKSLITVANLDNGYGNIGDCSRGPEHLSAYSLILEEGTPFYERRDNLDLPDEDSERIMYECTHEVLEQYGYHQYEISNYARDGRECRHNKGYWTGVPYLGFGLGASSLWGSVRYHNTRKMKTYLETPDNSNPILGVFTDADSRSSAGINHGTDFEITADHGTTADHKTTADHEAAADHETTADHNITADQEIAVSPGDIVGIRITDEVLSKKDQEAEFMITGLRMTRGISKSDFADRFGETVESVYGKVIHEYRDKQLLKDEDGRIFLTRRGISLSNLVMADFL